MRSVADRAKTARQMLDEASGSGTIFPKPNAAETTQSDRRANIQRNMEVLPRAVWALAIT